MHTGVGHKRHKAEYLQAPTAAQLRRRYTEARQAAGQPLANLSVQTQTNAAPCGQQVAARQERGPAHLSPPCWTGWETNN